MLFIYHRRVNSKYFNSDAFEVLESDISHISQNGEILLCGDFNARTGNYTDSVETEGNKFISEELNWSPTNETLRKSFNNVILKQSRENFTQHLQITKLENLKWKNT